MRRIFLNHSPDIPGRGDSSGSRMDSFSTQSGDECCNSAKRPMNTLPKLRRLAALSEDSLSRLLSEFEKARKKDPDIEESMAKVKTFSEHIKTAEYESQIQYTPQQIELAFHEFLSMTNALAQQLGENDEAKTASTITNNEEKKNV